MRSGFIVVVNSDGPVCLQEGLVSQLQKLEVEQEESQAELKAALIAHHMDKFQV